MFKLFATLICNVSNSQLFHVSGGAIPPSQHYEATPGVLCPALSSPAHVRHSPAGASPAKGHYND